MLRFVTAFLQGIKFDDTHSYRRLNLMTHIVTTVLQRIKFDDTHGCRCLTIH